MTACAAPGKRHETEAGYLCDRHLDKLGRWLRDVEAEAGQADPAPSLAVSYEPGAGAPAFEQVPVRLDAVVLTSRRVGTGWAETDGDRKAAGRVPPALVVLGRWASVVRRWRDLTPPTARVVVGRSGWLAGPLCATAPDCGHPSCRELLVITTAPVPPTVASERQVLTRHLPWCAGQPWAGRLYREVRDLRSALKAVNGNPDPQPLPGRCPSLVDGQECGGPLWPRNPDHTSGELVLHVTHAVVCGEDPEGHRWEGRDLARLALIVEQQQADARKEKQA